MKIPLIVVFILLIGGSLLTVTSTNSSVLAQEKDSSALHHGDDGTFINSAPDFKNDVSILPLLKRYITEKRVDTMPVSEIPLAPLTAEQLQQLPEEQDFVIRLGHSSMLMKLAGKFWLIDPVFSDRASPFSFAGPKRFHQSPIALDSLPEIEGVIISHDHYDHLDEASIKYLSDKAKHFVVPLAVDKYLKKWQVNKNHIHALDWWQSIDIAGVRITATPTQHFSGRGLFDKNETLWASYVIESARSKIYFSGDSGYFDGFKEIGERLGPFDLTMIETGAYDKDWSTIHMTPEESLQAHIDLKGRQMMPVHNGTFDLAFHSWYEPLERIHKLAQASEISLLTPIMGQAISARSEKNETTTWWRQVKS
ncbi:MBL fold metallo-hydrolase [Thalassotalea atypica]|uniref:MBL fold metallo-hydrolase n=1 Tax=Thalassotalea atypica TaxID=2054316 RepID=UPI00257434F1|nr:MBL fold metallo-hydrolase [Thalassotalea atypica]